MITSNGTGPNRHGVENGELVQRLHSQHTMKIFADRKEAGAELAKHLEPYRGRPNLIVLALPRGGVPVAYEVAQALDAPLDVFVVRKLGLPGQPEYAIGAIAAGGVRVLNEEITGYLGIRPEAIEQVVGREQIELARQERAFRDRRPPIDAADRTVVLVDDGLATGSTMKAAVQALRAQDLAEIIVAAPVGSPQACAELAGIADSVVCAYSPERFSAVGLWYRDFSQTTDGEVRTLLAAREAALAS
jgi:putative phosphoribosyl transferase